MLWNVKGKENTEEKFNVLPQEKKRDINSNEDLILKYVVV